MLKRSVTVRGCMLFALLSMAHVCSAAPITVDFVSALLEFTGPEPLPVELSGFPNNLRLRFHVPAAASIRSLNSVSVEVDLYDDGDQQDNESGDLVVVLQQIGMPNFVLQSFGPGMNGYTSASPLTVTGSVDASQLPDTLTSIQDDGFFLVRVNRNSGDFLVQSARATIDAELVPEPGTLSLLAAGFAALLIRGLRRSLAG